MARRSGERDAHPARQPTAGLERRHAMARDADGGAVEPVVGVGDRLDADIGIAPGAVELQLAEDRIGGQPQRDCVGRLLDQGDAVPALIAVIDEAGLGDRGA